MALRVLMTLAAAGALSIALSADAQQQGQMINLDGTQFEVYEWRKEQFGEISYTVVLPRGSRPWAGVYLYVPVNGSNGRWSVGWQLTPREKAGTSCADEERWVRALARHAGVTLSKYAVDRCKWYTGFFEALSTNGTATMTRAAAPAPAAAAAAAAARCRADAYVGAWQRPGTGRQSPQVQIVFTREGQEGTGLARGYNNAPYRDGHLMVQKIYGDGQNCSFEARCGDTMNADRCTVKIDPAAGTLTMTDSFGNVEYGGTWTRAASIASGPKCSGRDIEGDWHRSDGSLVPIVGVDGFARGPGGNALLFNHPENWPRGQSKFRAIYRKGGADSCQMTAICAGYDRNSSTGAVIRNERSCELTVDPARGTLRESGSTYSYSRTPGGRAMPVAAPSAPPIDAQEVAATRSLNADQVAAVKRSTAAFDAEKKRIADEQAAKEAAYRKALADRAAQIAETERKHREAVAKWEADVAACKAGDFSRCGPMPQ